jgi:hypothetical protein
MVHRISDAHWNSVWKAVGCHELEQRKYIISDIIIAEHISDEQYCFKSYD